MTVLLAAAVIELIGLVLNAVELGWSQGGISSATGAMWLVICIGLIRRTMPRGERRRGHR